MADIDTVQPDGTPIWVDLGIPDLDRALEFYGALFGWEFDVGSEEVGRYTNCLRRGRPVAAIMPDPDPAATEFWWNVYFATADCAGTAAKARRAGGRLLSEPIDVFDQGRLAIVRDPTGAQFGLWQAGRHIGCQVVNEPNALLRNDLTTARPQVAGRFYRDVFDFTPEPGPELGDFTFLRRPDGHEIGGIAGDPAAARSRWGTLFQVSDVDETVARAVAAGGGAVEPHDMIYGRLAEITDPFGTPFQVGSPRTG